MAETVFSSLKRTFGEYVTAKISKHRQRDDTKSIATQPVYYRKIEHEIESYNTRSIVMQQGRVWPKHSLHAAKRKSWKSMLLLLLLL